MKKIVLKPIITEKALRLAEQNQFTLEVPESINKIEIARLIASEFKVGVEKVTIAKRPPKPKGKLKKPIRFTKAMIKAIITLKKGDRLPGFEVSTGEEEKKKESKS